MIRLTIISCLIFLTFSCKVSQHSSLQSYEGLKEPLGTLKLFENVYLDKTEITNISWAEYLYWVKKVYGSDSPEYQNALPNSKVWSDLNGHYSALDTHYLNHPAYRDFPVVGISYEQALDYSKWRSDRVMEYLLIEKKIIPHNPTTDRDSVFTIEKYFRWQYRNIQPNPKILFYPEYRLPDSSTFVKLLPVADSIDPS